jgi:hypothetical protein
VKGHRRGHQWWQRAWPACQRVSWWSGSRTCQHVVVDLWRTVIVTGKAQRMISSLECQGRSEDPPGWSWRTHREVVLVVWPGRRQRMK